MVFRPTDRQRIVMEVPGHASDISPQFRGFGDGSAAFLGEKTTWNKVEV